jgi:hypothetical protein
MMGGGREMKNRLMVVLFIVAAVSVVLLARAFSADKEEDLERARVLADTKERLDEGDRYLVVQSLNSGEDPEEVAGKYSNLVMDFYWKEHDLPRVTFFANAGMQYCLTEADRLGEERPETVDKLKSTAKAIAYNLASFTWPGWDEEGITITDTDLAVGLDAARLNLRLAEELSKPVSAVSAAYWVLGAQLMAANHLEEAEEAFTHAADKSEEAGDEAGRYMNLGYIGIAKILEGSDKTEGQRQFEEAVDGLTMDGSEEAEFYRGQLKSVLQFFSAR